MLGMKLAKRRRAPSYSFLPLGSPVQGHDCSFLGEVLTGQRRRRKGKKIERARSRKRAHRGGKKNEVMTDSESGKFRGRILRRGGAGKIESTIGRRGSEQSKAFGVGGASGLHDPSILGRKTKVFST